MHTVVHSDLREPDPECVLSESLSLECWDQVRKSVALAMYFGFVLTNPAEGIPVFLGAFGVLFQRSLDSHGLASWKFASFTWFGERLFG